MERNNKKDYSIEDIEQKIKELKGFEGHEYSKEEIMEMTKSKPAIYGCSMENIKQKIKDGEEHEYSKEEIIKILEQQKYIAEQEKEISELAREKDEHE